MAQVVADDTLPSPSIVPANCTVCEITGGTTRGANLFHSFEQFNVIKGGEVYFNNDTSIENIFSRVTGDTANIDGLIRNNGAANLFLLSPRGITFGPNATLSIGGSFIASTAESVSFSDGFTFTPETTDFAPTLTISVPIGLQLGANAGSITNRSQASPNGDINALGAIFGLGNLAPVGLKTAPQETLALIGNGVVLDNGNLTAPGGHIELASLAPDSTVQLSPTDESFRFRYGSSPSFQDLTLTNFALVDVSDLSGTLAPGSINLSGRNIEFSQLAQAFSLNLSPQKGQPFTIQASETLRLEGAEPDSGRNASIVTLALGDGPANSINVTAKNVAVLDGASLGSATVSTTGGNTGQLSINAVEEVRISGETVGQGANAQSFIATQVVPDATGSASSINLTAQQLIIEDGAQLTTTTFGQGNAGNLEVNVSDEISVNGATTDGRIPSGISAAIETSSNGRSGDITISAPRIRVTGGSQISNATRGANPSGNIQITASDSILLSGTASNANQFVGRSGVFVSAEPSELAPAAPDLKAGTLKIETPQLTVEKGARISADTFRQFRGGDVELTVEQLSLLAGGQIRTASLLPPDGSSPTLGKGGTLTANISERLEISGSTTIDNQTVPSALVAVAEGSGAAGELKVLGTIDRNLDVVVGDGGEINASTLSTTGGNIDILNTSTLLLTDGGRIAAEAGSAKLSGDGGNININSTFVVAPIDVDADIVANSFEGKGGNINITAQSVLGFEQRRATPSNGTNDLDASSELGVNGNVTINQPDVDPTRGLTQLPTNVSTPKPTQACETASGVAQSNQAEFFATGRGGLPPSPNDSLSTTTILDDLRIPPEFTTDAAQSPAPTANAAALNEATQWDRNARGEVVLTAQASGKPSTSRCKLLSQN